MGSQTNKRLKGCIYEKFDSQVEAAGEFEMDEYRLSRIIHGRATPRRDEIRRIAKRLKRKISEIFPEKEEK